MPLFKIFSKSIFYKLISQSKNSLLWKNMYVNSLHHAIYKHQFQVGCRFKCKKQSNKGFMGKHRRTSLWPCKGQKFFLIWHTHTKFSLHTKNDNLDYIKMLNFCSSKTPLREYTAIHRGEDIHSTYIWQRIEHIKDSYKTKD